MPRDNYIITSDDEFHATFYLSGRLRNYGFKFRDSVSSAQAEYTTIELLPAKRQKRHEPPP